MLRQREPREKDEAHLDYVRSLACCICRDNTSTEAAHIRVGSLEHGKRWTGMQEKSSDKWAVPLCGKHHREQHSMNEMAFWQKHGINPFVLAIALRSRP
jgi:hypothetical protein